jgi:hypothetical protein
MQKPIFFWYAIGYAKSYSRLDDAVIRLHDQTANVNGADSATKIASAVRQVFTQQIVPLLRSIWQ